MPDATGDWRARTWPEERDGQARPETPPHVAWSREGLLSSAEKENDVDKAETFKNCP